ncbi:serine/threonine-protein kinase [Bradyrhizobium sp. S69]|uniref:serine/threonine-protein kinase n=1 Tax=Bradyrhizobium sp. S69 TaxID=1641856 RepID=UPI00131BABFD|nr:serine/threonine-protein kinase [Bradyrhizobium sp. S69]
MTLRSNLKIGPPIGAGFFGEVFSATDDAHGTVAVKIQGKLPFEADADWQLRRNSHLAEGQRLSRAKHANVVQIHTILEDDASDAVLIVMDLCPGGSLQSRFELDPMSLAEVRKYTTQVTMGLVALHSRQMLHRDIKPGNILLNRQGTAQIGDFGLVTDNIILGYGSATGYSDHLSPEVLNGGGTSVKSDIWALGMTMYRLLHGSEWYSKLPFPPRNVVGKGGFAKSLPWLPHIPQAWRTVIRTMMNDDPGARYQNGSGVLRAFARLVTTPQWQCSVRPGQITWRHQAKGRNYFVDWTETSSRKYDWAAWSEPVGQGNRRSFGKSKNLDYGAAERELNRLFATKLANV